MTILSNRKHGDLWAPRDRCLAVLLRVMGGTVCFAVFPVFMPLDWMAAIHHWLGLGPFPTQPIFSYLARSLSLMYFAHGVLVLFISFDVTRYQPLILPLGSLSIVMGMILIWIGCVSGMPRVWVILEGPPVIVAGLTLILLRRGKSSGT